MSSKSICSCLFLSTILISLGCKTSSVGKTENVPVSGAAVFTWGTYFDTDIKFSDFFNSDYTIMVRFMPQYELSYEGPLIVGFDANGNPNFMVSMIAEYKPCCRIPYDSVCCKSSPNLIPYILVSVAGSATLYRIPWPLSDPPDYGTLTHAPIKAQPVWRQLFLVRRNGMLEVWLDGDHLCRDGKLPAQCDLPIANFVTSSNLRLGKYPIQPGHVQNQFFGFIDDVGVFDHAFTSAEIGQWNVSGNGIIEQTQNLRFGLNFDRTRQGDGIHIRPPSTLNGTSRIVTISSQHDKAIDAPTLPVINGTAPMELPFKMGETWEVLQDFNTGGSHGGNSAFCWDFIFVPATQPRGKPVRYGQSDSLPFIAASDGTVDTVYDQYSDPYASGKVNFIDVRRNSDEVVTYVHIRKSSAFVKKGSVIHRGDNLALVSNVGGGPIPHLHMSVMDSLDGNPLAVTRPSYFVDYCASDDFGQTWEIVRIGIPRVGQWVRRLNSNGTCP